MTKTETAYFIVDTERTDNLDETLELVTDGSDLTTTRRRRCLVRLHRPPARAGPRRPRRGSLAKLDELPPKLRADPLKFDAPQLATLPDVFPNGLANKLTFGAIGELCYRKTPKKARAA